MTVSMMILARHLKPVYYFVFIEKWNLSHAELPHCPCTVADFSTQGVDSSNTVKQGSCPCSQSSLGRDKTAEMCWSKRASLHCANDHQANWLAVSFNVKPCGSPPFPQLNRRRQQPPFCNGINWKIENGLLWESRKCDMWSTVIRAYRVKTVKRLVQDYSHVDQP